MAGSRPCRRPRPRQSRPLTPLPSGRRRSSRRRAPPRRRRAGTRRRSRPSKMTRIRSESERISSSSSETSRMPRPSSRSSTSRRCTNSIAPTSRPRVGCAAISTFGLRSISRASTTFCWLPPERPPARVCGPPPRTSNSLQQDARLLDQALREEPAVARRRRMVVVVESEVLGQREVEHEAAPLPVLGDVPESRVEALLAGVAGDVLVADRRSSPPSTSAGPRSRRSAPSARCRRRPRSRRSRRRLTSNETSRTCSMPRSSSTVSPSTASSGSVGCAGALSTRRSTSRPTISRARPSSVAPAAGSVSIFLPRRSTVIRSAISVHLVQLVADEDDRLPLLGQAPDDREQLLRLLRGQHGGRLVEHEDVGAAVERLQDLDALLLADRDVLDDRARVDCEPEAGRDLAHALLGRGVVEQDAVCAPARSRARCSRRPSSPGSA